jgi:hypothetical protein
MPHDRLVKQSFRRDGLRMTIYLFELESIRPEQVAGGLSSKQPVQNDAVLW